MYEKGEGAKIHINLFYNLERKRNEEKGKTSL